MTIGHMQADNFETRLESALGETLLLSMGFIYPFTLRECKYKVLI